MTVGFHSPLPPARTGVADYAAALLAALRAHGDVRTSASAASVHLYHLGNNSLHREIYQLALSQPGVVVLHDAVLQHFFLGSLDESRYCEEFVYNYGAWLRPTAEKLYRQRHLSATSPRYFRYPMLKRILERSLAAVVHNPGALALAREHCSSATLVEIPHLWVQPPPVPAYELARCRAALQFTGADCIFGVFGHLRESKRIFTILGALARLRRAGVPVGLVLAGDCVSADLARALPFYMQHLPWVRRFAHLPEREFYLLAGAIDVCINLRHPPAGETSGIAIRLMGLAKPVILTRCEENSRFPDAGCLRVDSGVAEERMLAEICAWLTTHRSARLAIGAAAATHIRRVHHVAQAAAQYWRCLADAINDPIATRTLGAAAAAHQGSAHENPADPDR